MNRSVGARRASSTSLLVVGSWTTLVGVVVTVLAARPGVARDDPDRWELMLGWVVFLVGAAVLLVGLIAKGVVLGMAESRDR